MAGRPAGEESAGQLHPFVRQAARLAVRALKKGSPERYLWIDEAGDVAHVGTHVTSPAGRRKLWIPPSTGWVTLDPRAQQLVADIVLMLSLIDRAEPLGRERRFRKATRTDLPPCLRKDRSPLGLDLTVGHQEQQRMGSGCKPGCPFGLCPYPPRTVEASVRAELNEVFARRQQLQTRGWLGRFRWFGTTRHRHRFWNQMVLRACDAEPPKQGVWRRRFKDWVALVRP
jgi:hypothetical protein